jgi:hypothetical protein
MDKVYYHELGHAIMDTLPDGAPNPYLESWGRTVEESLANAIAYRCFKGKETLWVQRLIQDQPAEYRGYAATNQLSVPWLTVEFLKFVRDWYYEYDWLLRPRIHAIENALRRLESGEWHPETVRELVEFLNPLAPLAPTKGNGRIDSRNITKWKAFKRKGALPEPSEAKAWKGFAKYLLIEGVS